MEHWKAAGLVELLNIQELKLDSNQTSSCQKAPKTGTKVCLSIPCVGRGMFIMCQADFWVGKSAVWCRSWSLCRGLCWWNWKHAPTWSIPMKMQLLNDNKRGVHIVFSTALIVESHTFTSTLVFWMKIISCVLTIRGRKNKQDASVFSVCLVWCLNCRTLGSNFIIPEILPPFSVCFPVCCNSVIAQWPISIWRDAPSLICHSSPSFLRSPEPAEPNSAQLTVTTWQPLQV